MVAPRRSVLPHSISFCLYAKYVSYAPPLLLLRAAVLLVWVGASTTPAPEACRAVYLGDVAGIGA